MNFAVFNRRRIRCSRDSVVDKLAPRPDTDLVEDGTGGHSQRNDSILWSRAVLLIVWFMGVTQVSSANAQLNRIFRVFQERAEPAAAPLMPAVQVGEVAEALLVEEPGANDEDRGPLADFSNVINQTVKFEIANDRLQTSEVMTFNDFQQAMYQSSHLFGGGGTSSSSGGETWRMSFNWQWIRGQADYQSVGDESRLLITATEQIANLKHLQFEVKGPDVFALTVWSPKTSEFIRFRQNASTGLSLVYFSREHQLHSHAASFSAMLRKIPAGSRPAALDALRKAGFPLPSTPYDSSVAEQVLAKLCTELDPERAGEFRKLVAGFDSDNYDERMATSQEVEAGFKNWEEHIAAALTDETYSLEARSRLRTIYFEKAEGDRASATDVMSSLGLHQDPVYLAWLLGQTEDTDQQRRICQILVDLSDQTFGEDIEAWKQWGLDQDDEAAGQGPTEVASVERQDPLATEGQLDEAKKQIASLIRLVFASDQLTIDEALWKEPYGEKSIQEVNQEIKAILEKYKLPANLWQGDQLANLGDAAYPVAVFANLERQVQQIKSPPQHCHSMSNTYGGNPNPNFSWAGLSFAMQTQLDPNAEVRRAQALGVQRGGRRVQAQAEKFYDIQISENISPYRQLRVGSFPANLSTHIGYYDPTADYMFALTGSPERGWNLQLLWGDDVKVLQGETPAELMAGDPELFTQQIFPLLRKVGVQVVEPTSETKPDDASSDSDESSDDKS